MSKISIQSVFLGIVLLAEVVIFGSAYLFGEHGIKQLKQLKNENEKLDSQLEQLKQEIGSLENQLQAWETNSFYQEQVARERLHLSKPNEQIYYLD